MCFNASTSFLTFIIGIVSSIALIRYGNKLFFKENYIFGIFNIFISFIQLMDFCFWIDINNKMGLNNIITLIGPWLNVGQPLIIYIIKLIYFKPTINLFNYNLNTFYLIINILYLIYLFQFYIQFLHSKKSIDKIKTGTSHGHLYWPWIPYSNPYFYLILLTLNFIYLTNWKYNILVLSILYFFLFLSFYFFQYNVGELWCFFGAFMPILFFIGSYYI